MITRPTPQLGSAAAPGGEPGLPARDEGRDPGLSEAARPQRMGPPEIDAGPAAESTIDWKQTRRFIGRVLASEMNGASRVEIEDLTQEAAVRLLRTLRREKVTNLDGLMADIARKTARDGWRRRKRWRTAMAAFETAGPMEDASRRPEALGDPLERIRFVVLAFFRRRSPGCHNLAVRYFSGPGKWSSVAAELGRRPEAIRQQWSRCVGLLRREAGRSGGPLAEWTRER